MTQKPNTTDELQQAINEYHANGLNKAYAARAIGIPESTFRNRLKRAIEADLRPTTTHDLPAEIGRAHV